MPASPTGSSCAPAFAPPRRWPTPRWRDAKAAAPISATIFPAIRSRPARAISRDRWTAAARSHAAVTEDDRAAPRAPRHGRRAGSAMRNSRCRSRTGATVLDALIWMRAHRDPSLAIRYSCINANVCKECLIAIDGEVGYACTTRLRRRCGDGARPVARQAAYCAIWSPRPGRRASA